MIFHQSPLRDYNRLAVRLPAEDWACRRADRKQPAGIKRFYSGAMVCKYGKKEGQDRFGPALQVSDALYGKKLFSRPSECGKPQETHPQKKQGSGLGQIQLVLC